MKYYAITDKGKVRQENQDCFSLKKIETRDSMVVVLCDGMGSSKTGGVASELASKAFADYAEAKLSSRIRKDPDCLQIVRDACAEANSVTYDYSRFDVIFNDFGTTLVGAIIRDSGKTYIANVGDSRAYHVSRRGKGFVKQLTVDNSLVEEMVEAGIITKEQARNHPNKNVITRALGSEPLVECDTYETDLKNGDMLLLCSDGLSNFVTDEEMLECFMLYKDPETFCRTLLDLTFDRGARDNVTIISVVK